MAFRTLTTLFRPVVLAPARSFASSTILSARIKRKTYNPHSFARAQKQREANIELQERLRQERTTSKVDPVVGRTTPFLEAIETKPKTIPSLDAVRARISPPIPPDTKLNHFLGADELPELLERSLDLATPRRSFIEEDVERKLAAAHAHKVEAIRRIVALANGSSGDHTRAKVQQCIDEFGRHTTDTALPIDPGAWALGETGKTPRAGPDTGSSEVQAAILTVKIRTLRQQMEKMGSLSKDKHNKRNLRLMVHRRQKLLKYLKKKEKGGIRYRNIMNALGLDDAAVENELFL